MSHGKESARDLRYGRRGGRWAPSNVDERTMEQIKADTLAAGLPWPGELVDDETEPSLFDLDAASTSEGAAGAGDGTYHDAGFLKKYGA